jgi:Mor family transcriptional regulator
LVEETDETKRQTSLIAEEKAKLNALVDLVDMRPDPLKRVVAE